MHVIAGKAICFKEALTSEYNEYMAQVVKNAKALAKGLMDRGVNLVSGGTDNHLMLIDLRGSGRKGNEMETLLPSANTVSYKHLLPGAVFSVTPIPRT